MFNKEHNKILADELANRSLAQVIAETGILVLITLTALVGNSCVLYVFYKTPSFRKVANYYLITLAISDVVFSFIGTPVTIAVAATGRDVYGKRAGEAFGMVSFVLIYGSFLTTVLIAVNRFLCVVKPRIYKKYFKPKPAIIMIVTAWVFSIGIVLQYYLSGTTNFEFYPGRLVYYPTFTDQTAERVATVIAHIGYLLFLALLAFCYWKIYKAVKGHNATVSTTLNAGPSGTKPSKEEINITMSVLPLVCGSVLCWFPTSTVIHIDVYVNLPRSADMFIVYMFLLNSAINPFIFNIFNKPFRRQFLKIFGYGVVRVKDRSKEQNAITLELELSNAKNGRNKPNVSRGP